MDLQLDSNTTLQEGADTLPSYCTGMTGSPTQQQHCVQATGQRVELSVQSNGGSLLGIKSDGMLTLRNPQDPTSDKLDSECKYHCKLVSWYWELPFNRNWL